MYSSLWIYMEMGIKYCRNIFDWICYAFLLASTITHVCDVMIPNLELARWHNRIMSVNIMLVWLRTMKYVRCFSALGKF